LNDNAAIVIHFEWLNYKVGSASLTHAWVFIVIWCTIVTDN